MSNHIAVVGTIATDPKEVITSSEARFCSFRLASNERRYDREKSEWVDGPTNWFTVNAFRTLGEHALQSFRKGDRVVLSGRLRVRSWERDGKSGTSVDVEADALGHDLRWGVSRFTKVSGQFSSPGDADRGARDRWANTDDGTAGDAVEALAGGASPSDDAAEQQSGFDNPDAGEGGFADAHSLAAV